MLDCTDVNKLIANKAAGREDFVYLSLLTRWVLDCLNQIKDESRDQFPKTQEQILFDKIKAQVRHLENDLINLAILDLKYIGVILRDYEVGGNVNFHKFLVECLFSCYKSISNKMDRRVKNGVPQKFNDFLQPGPQDELKQYLNPENKAEIDRYLNIRKDSDSLYTIYHTITSVEEIFKVNDVEKSITDNLSIDKKLIFQRLIHIIGEYVKDTPNTPNLLSDVRELLDKKGVPVKALSKYRDMLTHYQVFPLINGNVDELYDKYILPICENIKSTIFEIEDNFFQKRFKIGNSVVENLKDSKSWNGVQGLQEYITRIQSEYKSLSMDNEIKQFDVELHETAKRMKSMVLPVVSVKSSEGTLSKKNSKPSDSFVEYINESYIESYNKLRDSYSNLDELNNAHADVLKIIQVVDRLSYKDTSSPANNILDKFLDLPILKNICVKIKKGKEVIETSTLKNELEKYFDAESFNTNESYVKFNESTSKKLIDLLDNNITKKNDNKQKLIEFFKDRVENYITPEEYARLVNGLKIKDDLKEQLLKYSIEWSKKKCVDLLNKNPSALKTIYDSILEGKLIDSSVYDKLIMENGIRPKDEVKQRVEQINRKMEELYSRRAQEESRVLAKAQHPYAALSQFLNSDSLFERGSAINKGDEENNGGEENKRKTKKFRNFAAHGSALLTIDEHEIIAQQLVVVKNDPVVKDMLNDPKINPTKFQNIVGSVDSHVSVKKIGGFLCPDNQRARRSANKNCLTWEEIGKFDKRGAKNRDPDNIIIDSKKFMSIISNELETNEAKFSNFIALASESEVVGDHKNKVSMLTNKHRYLGHLERIGKVSGVAMHGIIAKTLVVDILRGDYEDLAINAAVLTASPLLAKAANFASVKGAGYILKGKVRRGRFLKVASPFISSGLSAFTVYDLVNQVENYRNGDKDALVPIIGNSIELVTDVTVIGAEIGEAFGFWRGVSAYTGPIGITIGALVFVGTGLFKAGRKLEETEKFTDLTTLEKFAEGSLAFFGLRQSDYIEEYFKEKNGNDAAVKDAMYFLENNPHIQRYVFPSMEAYTTSECPEIISFFTCNEELRIIKSTDIKQKLNNVVGLHRKRTDIKWSNTRPDDVKGINFFCLPKGNWESVPEGGTYYCDGAIGVEYTNDRTGNDTLISLGDGYDIIEGFEHSNNIFVFGDGHKYMGGGYEDDKFIFERKSVNATNDSNIHGSIDGAGGIDIIDVGNLAPHYEWSKGVGRYHVSADLRKGILKDTSKVSLNIRNINVFLGRVGGVDQVVSACDTKHVDGRGGENKNYLDSIIIPKDDTCPYDTTVIVNPYTKVTNNATRGNFSYIVKGEKGKEAYIVLGPNSQSNNTFTFNYKLTDVAAIDKSGKNITFSFVEEFYKREKKIDANSSFKLTISGAATNLTKYHLTDHTKIAIGQNIVYAVQNTKKPINSLVKDYSSIAEKSQMYVVVYSNDEILTIGTSYSEVFMNNPNARTNHIVGGGGQNLFVITSGSEKLTRVKLPISEVVMYDFDQEEKTYILDLNVIKEQLKKDIDREINIEVSKFYTDLVINVSLDDASKEEVVKIRLKDALRNDWYKKVHVVFDYTFVIEQILDAFELTPQPLIFNDNSITTYVINPTDVAKRSKIRVKKEIGDFVFARNNDSLIITNSDSNSTNENNLLSIILNDFYNGKSQDKMRSLKIVFNDKRILLWEKMLPITSIFTKNYSELNRKVRINGYKAIMDKIKKQKLFEAIEANNIGEIKEVIDHGVSIDVRNDDGQTPLHSAAKSGKLEVVKYLIEEKGADVNVKDNWGKLPLHYAVISDNLEVVKYFIEEKGADVNAKDGYRRVPLHLAAEYNTLEVIKYLIEEKGADIDARDYSKKVPLHLAANGGRLEVIKYLIEEKGVDVNVKDNSGKLPLHYAVISSNLDVVKYLIEEKGASVNVRDGSLRVPLHLAAEYNRLKVVKYLIEEKGTDVDVRDLFEQVPLHLAAGNGNLDVVRYLIEEKGADINAEDDSRKLTLHHAVISGNLEIVKYLIEEKGANVNMKDNSGKLPLHYAVISSNLDVVKYLIEEKGASVNVRDGSLRVPLHLAAEYNRVKVVKYLIRGKGAAVDVRDERGRVPLHLAAINGNLEVIRYLLEEGANIDGEDYFGFVPLYSAASENRLNVVKYLVENGADVNRIYFYGMQLVHSCRILGIIKSLMDNGAWVGLKINSKTASNVLERKDCKDLVDIEEILTERLFDAVFYDDLGDVQDLINQRVGVNIKDSGGQPLLHFAASNGKLKVVKYLIQKKKVDFNVQDHNGNTPLHCAADSGNLELVKYLIEGKGANIDVRNTYGIMPLHNAAASGSLELVKYIIVEKNVNVNVQTNVGQVPLHFAAGAGNLEVVKYLVEEKNVNVNIMDVFRITPLHNIAMNGRLEIARYLIEEKNANVNVKNKFGITPLHNAVWNGNLELIKYLIEEKGADVNVKDVEGTTPLHHAVTNDPDNNPACSLSADGQQGLRRQIHSKICIVVGLLRGDLHGQPNLLPTCQQMNGRSAADSALSGSAGRTVVECGHKLHRICRQTWLSGDRLEIVKYLVEKRAVDVNVKDDFGRTPLDIAIATGCSDIVEYLERKLNEKREKSQRHKRSHHHLLHRLLTTDSSNQSEIATSNASEKSSRINDLVGSNVKFQESSAPLKAASSNHPIRHKRCKRHNDHSTHEDGMRMRMHRVRHRHRRVQKRNVKYQDNHFYIDQPEIAASSGTRPSSWINGLLDWIKEKGGRLVASVADKFAAKESEVSTSRGIHACSVRLEKMYSASIPNRLQSRKSQGVPKGNVLNTSWSDWSSRRERVTSNVTDAPEMNSTVLNNALILGDLAVRLVNGKRHKQPIHENLLSPREKSMRFIDENMIMTTIQQGKEKFGGLDFS